MYRTSESFLIALTTNMLHSVCSDTVIFSRNFHLRLTIADSADKQFKYFSACMYNILGFCVKNFPQCTTDNKIQGLEL